MNAAAMGVTSKASRRGLGACVLVLALLALVVPSARAETTYLPAGSVEGLEFPLGGVAVDNATGDFYVVDGKNAVVKRYDAAGTLISQFGGEGSGPGQFGREFFTAASGIAVDQSNGDVYVTDTVNNRIEKFSPAGAFLSQFDGTATPAGSFSTPTSVAVDPTDGSVYVVDAGHDVVDKFDSSGALVAGFGSGGSIGGFNFPTFGSQPSGGVAVDSSGRLYVGDPGNAVVDEYDASGAFQGQLGAGTLVAPSELAADSAGDVFAVDSSDESIVEFDPAGARVLSFADGVTTSRAPRGVAVSPDASRVYVSATSFLGGSEVRIFARAIVPDVVTGTATNRGDTTVTLNGSVNPDGVPLTDCHFAYTDQADFEANGYTGPDARSAPCTPAATSIPADTAVHPVAAVVEGLTPNTTYDFRLVAGNAEGSNHGQDLTVRTSGPPVIEATSVSEVTSTAAVLEARVNPEGADTTYHFDYGPTTAYGSIAPIPDADLGAGTSDQLASAVAQGLAPGTTYHYRVVATNPSSPAGGTTGPDRTFTTFPPSPTGLPDDRGYELVTPSDDLGNDVGPREIGQGVVSAAVSADGRHVIYKTTTLGVFGEPPNGLFGTYLASRATGGWSSTSLTPPASEHPAKGEKAVIEGASADFATTLQLLPNAIDPADQDGGAADVYARAPDGTFSWISRTEAEDPLTEAARSDFYAGASAGASHVLYETNVRDLNCFEFGCPYEAPGVPAYKVLHEAYGGVDRPVVVGTCGSVAGDQQSGHAIGPTSSVIDRAISADGSRVFFESPDPGGSGDPGCSPAHGGTQPVEVYVRLDGSTTTEVSLSQRAGSAGAPAPDGASYVGASLDGSEVFFTSPDQLTEDAPVASCGGREGSTCDLYRYDVPTGLLEFVAVGRPLISFRIPTISADGSHLYFLGEAPGGPPGQGLYLWDEGRTSYVSPPPQAGTSGEIEAEASADGSSLVFTSNSDLAGAEAHGHREVYVYTAAAAGSAGSLVCASCDPNGALPGGDARLAEHEEGAGVPTRFNRTVSANGGRVFFSSPDPLLPQATNGLTNVYEYEGGSLHLLSEGNGPYETLLVGASANGDDVIIATRDSLVPQDTDEGGGDLYDVRVGGGFPPSAPPPQCSGEGCQGEAGGAAPRPMPGSSTFAGPGNPKPRHKRCRKGSVRRHGRCVKKARRHRSHHPKPHRSARDAGTARRSGR